jgi:hypothetical protein
MARLACMISMLLVGALAAHSQNLAETALAAATGSVAGVAGKPISDGLSKIFGQVNAQAKTSATTAQQKNAPATPETTAGKAGASTPALGVGPGTASSGPAPAQGRSRSGGSRSRMHYAALPPVPSPQPAVKAEPPQRPLPTLDEIASVGNGTERSDVLTRLGTPVARLSIPESGQMLEVYQYVDRGGNLGSVRLRDGRVSEVRVDHQMN